MGVTWISDFSINRWNSTSWGVAWVIPKREMYLSTLCENFGVNDLWISIQIYVLESHLMSTPMLFLDSYKKGTGVGISTMYGQVYLQVSPH